MSATPTDQRPGPLPGRFVWRGWKTVAGIAFVAVLFAASQSHNRYFLGGAILAIGLLGLAWGLTRDDRQLHAGLRNTRGPGWWLGWLMSKLPGATAKIAFSVMCVGIVALGVAQFLAR